MSEISFTVPDPNESFTIGDIPPSFDSPDSANDLSCEVCGTPLEYSGRGRKPKFCADHKKGNTSRSTGTRRSSTRDVDAALSALEGLETILQMTMMFASPDAASVFEGRRDALAARNQKILEADPALAKRLSNAAAKGGGFALVLSYGVAMAPPMLIARADLRARAQEKADAQAAQEYENDPEGWRTA